MRYATIGLLLITAGLVIRVLYVQFVHPLEASLYSDMANYVQVADDILAGNWQAWHFFQPIGYPLLLSSLKAVGADWLSMLTWTQVIASTATLVLVWIVSTHCFGRAAGLASLAIAALHLPWIVYSGFALSETLFTFALAALALLGWRVATQLRVSDAVLWGIVFLLALLLKGTHIFLAPLFLLALVWTKGRRSWKAVLAITIVVWSGLIAHGTFTHDRIGSFQMTASAGGLNFLEGKCPYKNNSDSAGFSWFSPLYVQLGRTESRVWDRPFTDSAYYFGVGLECIKDNPLVLLQSLENIPLLFIGNWMWPAGNLPFRDWVRLYELFFSVFAIGGLCAFTTLARPRMTSDNVLVTWVVPLLALILCVYIFKSEIRFRIPFDVWIIPLAVKGWMELWLRRRAPGGVRGDTKPWAAEAGGAKTY
jgi:hypothetical protein